MMGAGAPEADGLLGNVNYAEPRSTHTAGMATNHINILGSLRRNICIQDHRDLWRNICTTCWDVSPPNTALYSCQSKL